MGTASQCAGVGRSPYTPGGRGHSCIPCASILSLCPCGRSHCTHSILGCTPYHPLPFFLLEDFQSLLQFMPIILLKGPLILHSLYSLLERRPFFQPRQVGNFVQVSAVRGQHDCRRSPAAVWLWPPTWGGGSCNHYQHCDHHHRHLCWPKQLLWNSY